MTDRRRFQDRSPAEKAVLTAVFFVSVVLVFFVERDIHSRPGEQIRGPKTGWRLVATNAVGALAYLGFGRRDGP